MLVLLLLLPQSDALGRVAASAGAVVVVVVVRSGSGGSALGGATRVGAAVEDDLECEIDRFISLSGHYCWVGRRAGARSVGEALPFLFRWSGESDSRPRPE
jgi:hypothetical protein